MSVSTTRMKVAGVRATDVGADTPPIGWWALGLGRIIIGYLWLQQTMWKLPPDFGSPGGCPASLSARHLNGLCDWMHREALHAQFSPYGSFVANVALPHFTLFGWLTWVTETFIAVSLLLGLVARLGALVGTLWALNLTIGLWAVPGEWYWTYLMLVLLNAIFMATGAGRYIGLDALLRRAARQPDGMARAIALAS
jgi:uncharacterized membrane protein YphA (DoxX/SURF4 family)